MANKKIDSEQPVTQAEFEGAMTAIKQDFNEVNDRLDKMEQLQEKTLCLQEATFTAVQSIEGRFEETRDHKERITRLEDHAFGPKSRR